MPLSAKPHRHHAHHHVRHRHVHTNVVHRPPNEASPPSFLSSLFGSGVQPKPESRTRAERRATHRHARAIVEPRTRPIVQQQTSTAALPFGAPNVVAEARRWIGTNPTHRRSLWCAAFMNFVLERTGHVGTNSNLARSFASYGTRVSGPRIGAIAVMSRKRGGHVGVVSGIDPNGNPIIISGNHNRRVAESVYPRGRIYAYVMPK